MLDDPTKPTRFRTKPVVIEAMQWDGTEDRFLFIETWSGRIVKLGQAWTELDIYTREGTMTASVGDWIIRDVMGEFYPCKPDIFEAKYEPA